MVTGPPGCIPSLLGMQPSLQALIACWVHSVCNGFLPCSLSPSLLNLHPLVCLGASPLSSSMFRFRPLLARDTGSSPFGGIWWPRGHVFRRVLHLSFQACPDSDHCLLGTRIPPHSEESGDPEARVFEFSLNCVVWSSCWSLSLLGTQQFVWVYLCNELIWTLSRVFLTLSNLRSSALHPPLLQLLITVPHAENKHETENEANCKEIDWGSGPETVFALSFTLRDTSILPTISVPTAHPWYSATTSHSWAWCWDDHLRTRYTCS